MAGIGFALSKLRNQNNLASQSMATGHAILITAGPWIVIMIGLALISWLGEPLVGAETTTTFRVIVIYCFALSLVVTASVALDMNLRISSYIFERQFERVNAVYFGALTICATLAVALACLLFFGIIGLDLPTGLAAVFCVVQVSLLWIAMSMVAAIKQYGAVTTGFTLGLSVSVALGLILAAAGYGVVGLLTGFGTGLFLAFAVLHALVIQTFPGRLDAFTVRIAAFVRAPLKSHVFVLAGVPSALAVWVDKLVVWQSYEGSAIAHGLVHAPRYDVPMFIAYLSIVPLMSLVSIWLETDFFTAYRKYRDIVNLGGTLRHIENQRLLITRRTIESIFSAFVLQVLLSVVLSLASPVLVHFLGLGFETLQVLRLALIGAAFHFLFLACCGVILFVQHSRAYLLLQTAFFVLNGVLTYVFLTNPDVLGLGYVIATGIAACLAYAIMLKTLSNMNHLTFVENNPAVAI